MSETRTELAVGESILVGDHLVTVVEIAGSKVVFRIETVDCEQGYSETLEFSSAGDAAWCWSDHQVWKDAGPDNDGDTFPGSMLPR